MFAIAGVEQKIDLLVANPMLVRRLQCAPRPIGDAFQFATLHGERGIMGVLVALDDLEFCPGQKIERDGDQL